VDKIKQKLGTIKKKIGDRRREYLAARPHKSFRNTKAPRTRPALITIKRNALESLRLMWRERRLFLILSAVYVVTTYIFVGGVAQGDFVELKEATVEVIGGSLNSFSTALSLLTSTMSGAFGSEMSEIQQFLAVLLGIVFWLTIVWALRMRLANEKINARDALYTASAPLVSYVVVGFFIILQLTPGAIGVFIFNVANSGGYIQGGVEVMAFALAAFLLGALSLYWLAGSLVALVIVTLPQMYPWRAIRIASELAIWRRTRLLWHTLALAGMLLLFWVVLLLPVLLLDTVLQWSWLPLVPIVVQALGAFSIVFGATYIYKLYRSML
jgi:hypothetical protein